MKKNLLGLLCVLAISATFISCKKENETEKVAATHYMKANIDGVPKNFTGLIWAHKENISGVWFFTILAGADNETATVSLISDRDEFVSGKSFTHMGPLGPSNGFGYDLNISGNGESEWDTHQGLSPKFECKLTEVTATYVKGTFSGEVYQTISNNSSVKKVITNGEFYAPIQ